MITNADELGAIVRRRRDDLAGRYEKHASDMAKIGEPDLARVFRALVDDSRADELPQARPGPNAVQTYVPDATALVAAEPVEIEGQWSAYSIWAVAVRNETKLFEDLTSLGVPMSALDLRSALAVEARACLDRAARYRVQRRLAFHANRLANETARFPDVRRIDTVGDFAHAALAIECYFLALMRQFNGSGPTLADVVDATERAIAHLEQITQTTEVPKRLQNALRRMQSASRNPKFPVGASGNTATRVALEANRIFDYYDQVFETSQDPQVTDAAQDMAARVIDRLQILKKQQFAT